MISSIVPISDAFVVVGKSDSSLQISRFPTQFSFLSGNESCDNFLRSSPATPLHNSSIGKCSRYPVGDLSCSGDSFAAVSAATLSTWDLVRGSRLRYWSTPDYSETCHYITPNLLAVAGHGCSVHFYDTRNMGTKPSWSLPLSHDNLYTMCGTDHSVFAAGADGILYKVDLRNGVKTSYDFSQPSTNSSSSPQAILDVSLVETDIVMLYETGDLLSMYHSPQTPSDDEMQVSFEKSISSATYTTRVGCNALQTSSIIHVATGSGQGYVSYFSHNTHDGTTSHTQRLDLGPEECTKVRWGPTGLYAGSGDELLLLPFNL